MDNVEVARHEGVPIYLDGGRFKACIKERWVFRAALNDLKKIIDGPQRPIRALVITDLPLPRQRPFFVTEQIAEVDGMRRARKTNGHLLNVMHAPYVWDARVARRLETLKSDYDSLVIRIQQEVRTLVPLTRDEFKRVQAEEEAEETSDA